MGRQPQVVVALLTPFGESGRCDLAALRAHVDFLLEAGVDALMPCGTTGEGLLLDDDETTGVIRAAVEASGGRARVLAHVGQASTAGTTAAARRALADGADGVSAIVPYYYSYSDDQLVRHYRALIEAAGAAPAYAYTLPSRTGNDLSGEVVRILAGEGLAGVKDSTKSWDRHLEYLACGLDVLVGTDAFVLQAFRAGAAGCVSALANVRPELFCALRDGAGEDVQEEILGLRDALPMQRLKAAVGERVPGYPGTYRPPLG